MKPLSRQLDWANFIFLLFSPLIGVVGTIYYSFHYGIHPVNVTLLVAFFWLTGLSITGGYHRYFAHKTYVSHSLLKLFYLVFGACALQNTALRWASDHRNHHRYTDTEKDPYNFQEGFWYAHVGWICYKRPSDPSQFTNVPDLLNDRLVMWQHRYYLLIAILIGFGIPTLVGLAFGHPLGGFLWGGILRVVLVHHFTFLVNSASHRFGKQPYANDDSSRDCWWLAFLTNGEGYHNFHHKFPSDYRNGIRWFHWDPTKWWLCSLRMVGLTSRLNKVSTQALLQARRAMERVHSTWQMTQSLSHVGAAIPAKLVPAEAGSNSI
ncbi:MAG: fatty acid desaturase [Elusimicrobia bacterium]|nr:fatty acid desaturase [Elusimicrobiota bacterium]